MSGFVVFGDTRIRKSNIKTYGIASETIVYEEYVEPEKLQGWLDLFSRIQYRDFEFEKGGYKSVSKEVKYLYVTTFQGDNYRFIESEVPFDIHEKCEELDMELDARLEK